MSIHLDSQPHFWGEGRWGFSLWESRDNHVACRCGPGTMHDGFYRCHDIIHTHSGTSGMATPQRHC